MIFSIITFLFLLGGIYFWKRRGLSISFIIWIWYAIMYTSSFALVSFYDLQISKVDNSAYIYMALVLLILLLPFYVINDKNVKILTLPSEKYLQLTITILTIGSLFSTIYYIPSALKALSVNIADIEYMRHIIGSTGNNPFIKRSLPNTIASIFATFFMLQIVFFFITVIKDGKIRFKSILILLSSTSYIFMVLSFLGRDCFVFWPLSFLILYVFFSRYLNSTLRKKIKVIYISILSVCVFVFAIITIGRFLYSSDYDSLYPILNYMGQGPINFQDIYNKDIIPTGGSGLFSLILGDADMVISNHNEIIYYQYGIQNNVFRTIVGSLYTNFGKFGTLIFAIILCAFIILSSPKVKYRWDLSYIIIYMLYVMIIYQGVFYYKLYDNASNLYIILSLIMAIILKKLPKQTIYISK